MIPIKLTIRNFMCYRDNVMPINFESIHTACISGNNGHGKSALIDAITWALWGQSRAASDDELVHAGQMETQVDFEFTVNGQKYEILRKHSKPKSQKSSGLTILEFRVSTPDGIKVLTGDSVSQTQQKIIQVIHMDYDTFINSAFIRQGHANEFTRKRAGERKQVLCNILQLTVFDELEERAKALSKEQQNMITLVETMLNSIQEELVRRPVYQDEYDKAKMNLEKADARTVTLEAQLALLRKDKENLDNKEVQLIALNRHIQDMMQNQDLWKRQAEKCHALVQGYEQLLSQREIIEQGHAKYLETRRIAQEFDQKAKQYNLLLQAKHRCEMTIIKAGEEISRSHAVTENRLRELDASAEQLPALHSQMKEVEAYFKKIEEVEAQNQLKLMKSQQIQVRLRWLESEQTRLKIEIKAVEDKQRLLSHQTGAICPLCESELGPEGQKCIETKYKNQMNEMSEQLRNFNVETKSSALEFSTLEKEIQLTESKLKQARQSTQTKKGHLDKAIADASEAEQKILQERINLEEIEKRMAARDFADNEQTLLSKVEKEITDLGYDHQSHEQIRILAADLEKNEALMRQLEEAVRLIQQEKDNEEQACRTIGELREKIENDNQHRQSLEGELKKKHQLEIDLKQIENENRVQLAEQKRFREAIGAAKARLDQLDNLEKRQKEKVDLLSQAVKQEKIYKDLAQAFGKKGLQAMLIEMAIPEIESEANRLLARMTDNRMHIKMETQRETKKREIQETLDINISDELGTRNYEMFSGGEAFRIDFAIRIALSKLLARRAGAPLPTLIIDEGFGTQDGNGIEKIKEAITSIQDDFEKILVITHITDFKDAFPLQIEVVKTSEGSAVLLN